MAIISQQKLQEIIKNAPGNHSRESIIKSLELKGHEVELPIVRTPVKKASPKPEGGFLGNLAAGFGKGAVSTLTGLSSLGERGLRGTLKALLPESLEKSFGVAGDMDKTSAEKLVPEKFRKPEGLAQKIGFGAEKIAEFLIPSSKIANVGKAVGEVAGATKLGRAGVIGGKALVEAGAAGSIVAAQKGKFDSEAKVAAIIGAMFPVAGAGFARLKGAFKPVGEKIQFSVIRPTARDVKDGFKIGNVSKHNVGGSLGETATKTHVKINKLAQELKTKLGSSKAVVNVNDVIAETAEALQKGKARQFGNVKAIERVVEALSAEAEAIAGKSGFVNLVEATNIKRGAGTKGAWSFGRAEPDAGAVEKVYTTFYQKMKVAIEKASPDDVAGINAKISELIPISNAAIRRLPIDQRNNIISLTDSIGLFSSVFDPRALALIGANRLSKSGKFGQFLINVADKKPTSSLGQRFLGDPLKKAEDLTIAIPRAINSVKKVTNIKEFEIGKGLSSVDRGIETKAFNKILKNEDEILDAYKKEHGNIINTDNFRPFFKDVGYFGANAASVQEPSSYLAKRAFSKMLENKGVNVPFYAGGSGSGKTSAIKNIKELNALFDDAAGIFDGNLSSYNSAFKKMAEANAAGKKSPIIYVYRDPLDSFENGVVKRMIRNKKEGGRIVPTKITAGNHIDSWDVAKRMYTDGKDVRFIDNSLGAGKAKLSTFKELDKKIKYPHDLKEQMDDVALKMFKSDDITAIQLKEYLK